VRVCARRETLQPPQPPAQQLDSSARDDCCQGRAPDPLAALSRRPPPRPLRPRARPRPARPLPAPPRPPRVRRLARPRPPSPRCGAHPDLLPPTRHASSLSPCSAATQPSRVPPHAVPRLNPIQPNTSYPFHQGMVAKKVVSRGERSVVVVGAGRGRGGKAKAGSAAKKAPAKGRARGRGRAASDSSDGEEGPLARRRAGRAAATAKPPRSIRPTCRPRQAPPPDLRLC
jgi:hypothetical protein